MPVVEVDGATLHYQEAGAGPDVMVFVHGVLTNARVFASQMAAFAPYFRCVAFDLRGHGASPASAGGYDPNALTADIVAVLDHLGRPAHLVGLCVGGNAAMRVAARRSDLVRSLILIGTSAEPEPAENMARYRLAGFAGRRLGFRPVVRWAMPLLFGRSFMADPARATEREDWRQQVAGVNRVAGSLTLSGAIERDNINETLHRIRAPTLVMAGAEDTATIPLRSERIVGRIRGSRLAVIQQAGHNAPVEQPAAVNTAMARFLAEVTAPAA